MKVFTDVRACASWELWADTTTGPVSKMACHPTLGFNGGHEKGTESLARHHAGSGKARLVPRADKDHRVGPIDQIGRCRRYRCPSA